MSVPDVEFLSSARFSATKFREGYDQIEVDEFLDELIAAIRHQDPAALNAMPEHIINKRFAVTKFREGYDMDDVDTFLDEVALRFGNLAQRTSTRATTWDAPTGSPQGLPVASAPSLPPASATSLPAASPQSLPPADYPRSASMPFDGAFFASLTFGHTRLGALDIVEVDKFVDHVKRVVWRNDPAAIQALSAEAIAKDFPRAGIFARGYASTDVYDFLEEVNARAATY